MNPKDEFDQDIMTTSHLFSPEHTLILLAKTGDGLAYAELCRRHSQRVFLTVLRFTKNREDAEDVLQESLMKALIHIREFDGRSAFSTWLTRIAINSALMMYRKKRTRSAVFIDEWAGPGSSGTLQIADRSPSAEEHFHRKEWDQLISKAIRKLPTTLRVPLEVHLAEDLPMKELARTLGLSLPAAKSRLMRARDRVRRSVVRHHDSPQ